MDSHLQFENRIRISRSTKVEDIVRYASSTCNRFSCASLRMLTHHSTQVIYNLFVFSFWLMSLSHSEISCAYQLQILSTDNRPNMRKQKKRCRRNRQRTTEIASHYDDNLMQLAPIARICIDCSLCFSFKCALQTCFTRAAHLCASNHLFERFRSIYLFIVYVRKCLGALDAA